MRKLYHYPLSPFSRKIRVILKEKDLEFKLIRENFWERRREYIAMNPSAQVPLLIEEDKTSVADSVAISEYLDERYPDNKLIGSTTNERAEIRRLSGWFNNKFYYEVTKYILDEKIFKHFKRLGSPNSVAIRAGKANILYHLDYIGHLTKKRKWLAGDNFSLADITAASHLSVLDYLGDVPWERNKQVKEWYAVVKSRPSFRPLLEDKIPGFKPPKHYKDLDF